MMASTTTLLHHPKVVLVLDPAILAELLQHDPPDPDIFADQLSLPDLPPCPDDHDPFFPYALWSLSHTSSPNRRITIYDPYFPIPEAGPLDIFDPSHQAYTALGHGFAILFPSGPDKFAIRVSSPARSAVRPPPTGRPPSLPHT